MYRHTRTFKSSRSALSEGVLRFIAALLFVLGTLPSTSPAADRKDGAGSAQALGMMGAAVAGMSCAMLMKAAEEEEDPSLKAMLQSQAMQQCAQAAQNAANAAKNDNAKNQASDTSPKTDSIANNAQTPSTTPDTTPAAQIPTTTSDTTPPTQVVDNSTPAPVDPAVFNPSSLTTTTPGTDTTAAIKNPMITLAPIPQGNIGFDDSKNTSTTSPTSGSPFFGSFGGGMANQAAKTDTSNDLRKLAADLTGSDSERRHGSTSRDGATGGGGDSSEGGSSPSKGGDDAAFNSMLSQLMGGGPKAELAMGTFEGFDNGVRMTGAGGKGKGPNIFEYASYRYRKVSHESGISTPVSVTPPSRKLASTEKQPGLKP